MNAVKFTTELNGTAVLQIPSDAAARLPKSGKVRVILLTDEEKPDDVEWRSAVYEQFLRDDPPEDAIYDTCR
jgi:hypothetical protein